MSEFDITQATTKSKNPVPSVAEQVHSGVDLTDLQLPSIPTMEVVDWEEESPLNIRQHEALAEYVFRWLNPRQRERSTMAGWKYVQGDMAVAVKRCGIVPGLVGGDSEDGLIRSGDLVLGWMPASWNEAYKEYLRRQNDRVMTAVKNQDKAEEEMSSGRGRAYVSMDNQTVVR